MTMMARILFLCIFVGFSALSSAFYSPSDFPACTNVPNHFTLEAYSQNGTLQMRVVTTNYDFGEGCDHNDDGFAIISFFNGFPDPYQNRTTARDNKRFILPRARGECNIAGYSVFNNRTFQFDRFNCGDDNCADSCTFGFVLTYTSTLNGVRQYSYREYAIDQSGIPPIDNYNITYGNNFVLIFPELAPNCGCTTTPTDTSQPGTTTTLFVTTSESDTTTPFYTTPTTTPVTFSTTTPASTTSITSTNGTTKPAIGAILSLFVNFYFLMISVICILIL